MLRLFCSFFLAVCMVGCGAQPPKDAAVKVANPGQLNHSMTAALPPKYLSIKQFKDCLATQTVNHYQSWCMPSVKPAPCPATSWEQLQALQGNEQVPACLTAAAP